MSAIIPYLQPIITNAQSDITDLQALSGMPDDSLNFGTFTGVTIQDNRTVKQALQDLETEVELRDSDIIQSKVGAGPGYRFDGVDDRITGIASSVINHNSWTWVADVDPANASGTYGIIYGLGTGGSFTNRRYLRYYNGSYDVTIGDSSATVLSVAYPAQRASVVVTHDGDTKEVKLHINGKLAASATHANQMDVGIAPLNQGTNIGSIGTGSYFNGQIYRVEHYNRVLTDSEIALVSNGQNLGFTDVGADGSASYTSDFSNPDLGGDEDLDGFLAYAASIDGNIDGVGGESNTLLITVDNTNSVHYAYKTGVFSAGKRYRISGSYYVSSANSNVDGILFTIGGSSQLQVFRAENTGDATWHDFDVEVVNTASNFADRIIIFALDGSQTIFTDAGGNDILFVKNIVVTPIGLVLDLNPSGAAPAIWADASGNGYNGTVTGATLINQQPLHADTFVSLTNLPTSSAGLGTGRVWNDSGTLKIV